VRGQGYQDHPTRIAWVYREIKGRHGRTPEAACPLRRPWPTRGPALAAVNFVWLGSIGGGSGLYAEILKMLRPTFGELRGEYGTPRPELPLDAGFMRRSCALDDNRSFLTIVGAARHEQPAVPASFVRIPPRRRYGVSQGARIADGVGTKYRACVCTGLEGPSEN
jgi:hypothetical protein